ncbi:unnamed protein product [Soboliphyme baturini]|uniref:SRCR domain-containing protein n=1 Tax=Soboliphyme baturini TaxID=241478 RepID=A0A183IJD5_9BILA|nr:unnamed protein product [Soboliphyme baturini]
MLVIKVALALFTFVVLGCQPGKKLPHQLLENSTSNDSESNVSSKPQELVTVVKERLLLDIPRKDKKQTGISRIFGKQLTSNTTLHRRNSPFEVLYNLVIPSSLRLTIEQGVVLRFKANASITVRGVLIANGTKQRPIQMIADDAAKRWKGLFFNSVGNTFDVRLDKSLYYDQGFLQIYDGVEWRYACGRYWIEANSRVACRQMGFEHGETDGEVHIDRFSDFHQDFSNSSMNCTGKEDHLKHCEVGPMICSVDQCQSVIRLKCSKLRGIYTETSVLNFVNVSSSEYGVVVRGLMPKMQNVYSVNSRYNGFTFDLHYIPTAGSVQIFDSMAVNSGLNGFSVKLSFPVYEKSLGFVLDKVTSIRSGKTGIAIAGRGTANSRYAMKIVHTDCQEFFEVGLQNCNITQQWRDAALLVDSICRTVLYFDNNSFWENYNGAIGFGRISKCQISVTNNLFYKNKGNVIRFHQLLSKNNIIFEGNRFDLNYLNALTPPQAALHIVYRGNAQDLSNLAVINNSFRKNTLTNIISLKLIDGAQVTSKTGLTFQFHRNSLTENLSPVVMFVDVPTAAISWNVFANPFSDYELMSGVAKTKSDLQAAYNYWGTGDEIRAQERLYDRRMNSSLMAINIMPMIKDEQQLKDIKRANRSRFVLDFFDGVFENGSFEVPERTQPFLIRNSITIGPGAVVTISPGNVLEFLPHTSFLIHGTLTAKGRPEKPIIFRSASNRPWLGIIFEEEGKLSF